MLLTTGKPIANSKGFTKLVHDINGNRYLGIFNKKGKLLRGIIQSPLQETGGNTPSKFFTRITVNSNGNPNGAKLVKLSVEELSEVYKRTKKCFLNIMQNYRMKNFVDAFSKDTQERVELAEKPIKDTSIPLTFCTEPRPSDILTGELPIPVAHENKHRVTELLYPHYIE